MAEMKVLLVYCNSMLENALPISLTQLSACLKKSGIEVELFDTTFYKWAAVSDTENRIEALQFKPCELPYKEGDVYEDFIKKIEEYRPDLVGFSIIEPTFKFGLKLLNFAKEIISKNHILVAMGGIHAIMAPEIICKNTDMVDFICISEGEIAFAELCKKLENGQDITNQKGFWIHKGQSWIKNDLAELVDLETLPILDFRLFPEDYLLKPMMGKMYKTISIELTRGCPYNCSYCCDFSLTQKFSSKGHWFRRKSMKKIKKELDRYVSEYNPEFVYIMSESFLAGSLERVEAFFDVYNNFAIPFWFNTRPEDVTREKVVLVKAGNCARISIGIESGNEVYRKNVMHRKVSNERILEAAAILHEYDMSFSVNIIIGLPNETREMIFDSIELARRVKADGVSTHIYSPFHGTELRDISIRQGYIKEDLIADDFFQSYLLQGGPLNAEEIAGLFRTIPLYVRFPKSEYTRIQRAEKFDEEGNRIFSEFRAKFYELMNWDTR